MKKNEKNFAKYYNLIFGQNEAFDFIPCGTERSEVKQGIKSKAELKAKNTRHFSHFESYNKVKIILF